MKTEDAVGLGSDRERNGSRGAGPEDGHEVYWGCGQQREREEPPLYEVEGEEVDGKMVESRCQAQPSGSLASALWKTRATSHVIYRFTCRGLRKSKS